MEQQGLTKSSSTSIQSGKPLLFTTRRELVKVRKSLAVKALMGNDFTALISSVGMRPGDILDRPNIAMLKTLVDTDLLEMFVAVLLTDLVDVVNIDQRLNIQGHQIPIIASQIIHQYPTESLEDFVLCFRRGSTGFYGTIYNLDASVLNNWMRAYLDEKYTLIEAEHAKVKKEEREAARIDYKAYIERREKEMREAKENPKAPENAKANELARFKLEYQERKAFQQRLQRASSEFYHGRDNFNDLKVFEDEKGFQVFALNIHDAEAIYNQVTK